VLFTGRIEADIELQDPATLVQTLAAVAIHRVSLSETRPTARRSHVLANKTKSQKLGQIKHFDHWTELGGAVEPDCARACGSSGHFISDMHDARHLESLGGKSHLTVARGRTADCGSSVLRHISMSLTHSHEFV